MQLHTTDWKKYTALAVEHSLRGMDGEESVADFWLHTAQQKFVTADLLSQEFVDLCRTAVLVPVNVFSSDRLQKDLAERFNRYRSSMSVESRREEAIAAFFETWREDILRFEASGTIDPPERPVKVARKLGL